MTTTKTRRLPVRERKITVTSPGEPVVIDGVHVATIWSDGPKPATVWAITADGQMHLYGAPTAKSPKFTDLQVSAPKPGEQWVKLMDLATAGRAIVVVRPAATGRRLAPSGTPTVHLDTCPEVASAQPGARVERVAGVAFCHWLQSSKTGTGFAHDLPSLTSVLDGEFCACTGISARESSAAA